MLTYIRIETHADAEEFAAFLRSKNIIPDRGPYYHTEGPSAIPCYYIMDSDTYKYKGWQPLHGIQSNNRYHQQYFKQYYQAIPSYVFINPDLYPEYFI